MRRRYVGLGNAKRRAVIGFDDNATRSLASGRRATRKPSKVDSFGIRQSSLISSSDQRDLGLKSVGFWKPDDRLICRRAMLLGPGLRDSKSNYPGISLYIIAEFHRASVPHDSYDPYVGWQISNQRFRRCSGWRSAVTRDSDVPCDFRNV